MFCSITLLTLLLQFFFGNCGYTFKVGGQEFLQVDLFESLQLQHNRSLQGIKLGKGVHSLTPAVIFSGDIRELFLPREWVDQHIVQNYLAHIPEFTISTNIKQNPDNVGTLVAFSSGLISALEIQSSGRKDELRLISGSMVESFPFNLADGSWHRLSLAFSASQVEIFVDCVPKYKRVLRFNPVPSLKSQNVSLFVGQQRNHSHFLFQGLMQDLRLTFGPYGYLSQCPQVDTHCPTCSEFNALKTSFASLQSQIEILTKRLTQAEARLSNVEQCECQKSCRLNDTATVNHGTSWTQGCQQCSCKKGEVVCQPMQCPSLDCKNPVTIAGECCPTCLARCYFRGRTYEHGEVESGRNIPMPECTECQCINGSMQCKKEDPDKVCPPLSCPPSQQIVVPEQCCKVCPGTDYCATYKTRCHSNATCVNLQTTFTCQCNEGYTGDGLKSCEDVDECLLERNHCAKNSVCVNLDGGYECECVEGFKKLNKFQCEDADECASGSHKCHKHATCTNTRGSYVCTCNENYEGDGFHCSPVCNRTCENGGLCIAPNVCSCRSGWTGSYCETDVDECRNDSNNNSTSNKDYGCPQNAVCINKPGWHLCQCREGFQLVLNQTNGQGHCQDVDECEEEDKCPEGMACLNTQGSYECRCPQGNPQCSAGCIDDDTNTIHQIGSQWISQDCQVCTCASPGTTLCISPHVDEFCSQNCTNNTNDEGTTLSSCCSSKCNNQKRNININNNNSSRNKFLPPQVKALKLSHNANNATTLTKKLKSCRHQLYPEIQYQSGERWYTNCQTCECLNGETDCWSIDCPPANCHNAYLQPGDCCYRCPATEDKCTHTHQTTTTNTHGGNGTSECHLVQDTLESGTRITLPHNCVSCKCQVPLCAKLVSKNDGICVLRMGNSVVVTTMIVWLLNNLLVS